MAPNCVSLIPSSSYVDRRNMWPRHVLTVIIPTREWDHVDFLELVFLVFLHSILWGQGGRWRRLGLWPILWNSVFSQALWVSWTLYWKLDLIWYDLTITDHNFANSFTIHKAKTKGIHNWSFFRNRSKITAEFCQLSGGFSPEILTCLRSNFKHALSVLPPISKYL